MANPEHLTIVKQGVSKWNWWRLSHPDLKPDLSRAELKGVNFSNAIFSNSDFSETDLSGVDLTGADLCSAELYNATLIKADLREAKLVKSSLRGADLSGAILSGAILSGAILRGAKLVEASLAFADLRNADFCFADLRRADLHRAALSGATLAKASLSEANLSGAGLNSANLSWANCKSASFYGADLGGANLTGVCLDGAILSDSCLWRTQRAKWSIEEVVCRSIYWDKGKRKKTIFSDHDFEKQYADKNKVRLFYKDCIGSLEIATLPALIKHLEGTHAGSRLRLNGIREDSGGSVVELVIEDSGAQSFEELKQFKAELEAEAQQKAQYLRQVLDEALQLKGEALQLKGQVEAYERVVGQLLSNQKPTYYIEKGGIQMGSPYNVNQAGAVGDSASAHDTTFNQIVNNFEKSIDLQALATQLAELRQAAAEKQDSSLQTVATLGRIAEAEMAAKQKNHSKVMENLKAAGQWTLDFAKEVGKDVVVEAIKLSMGMK